MPTATTRISQRRSNGHRLCELVQAASFNASEVVTMSQPVHQFGSHKALVLDASEHRFDAPTLANDLIGLAWEHEADVVAVSAMALPGQFYELRSGMLGEMAQKFANYRLHLVVFGDISAQRAASKAFRDYVYEANKGRTLWFVDDLDALEARLLGAGERTQ